MDVWRLKLYAGICFFGDAENATRFPQHNFTQQIITQLQGRSSVVGNSASAVNAQYICKSTFKALINGNYSSGVDTEKHQTSLEQALYKCSIENEVSRTNLEFFLRKLFATEKHKTSEN